MDDSGVPFPVMHSAVEGLADPVTAVFFLLPLFFLFPSVVGFDDSSGLQRCLRWSTMEEAMISALRVLSSLIRASSCLSLVTWMSFAHLARGHGSPPLSSSKEGRRGLRSKSSSFAPSMFFPTSASSRSSGGCQEVRKGVTLLVSPSVGSCF